MRHWESEREARRCWKAANREKVRASNRKRKAIKKGCNSTAVSPDIVQRLWVKQDGLCNNLFCNADLIFEIRMYHLDHILPFALGGKHEDSNLQLLCASCNLLKGARHPASGWEFIRARSSANG
jgi:5-methylcytosine-specific restriction endonuclease McrA